MKNLTAEELNEIQANAANYDGDLQTAIAAHVYGAAVVLKCGNQVPAFADQDVISQIETQIAEASSVQEETTPPPAEAPKPLEVIKGDFSDAELIRLGYEASKNNRDIRKEIALVMYGSIGLVNGEVHPMANANLIGHQKARYTRLLDQMADELEEQPETQPNEQETGNSNESTQTDAKENAEVAEDSNTTQNPPVANPPDEKQPAGDGASGQPAKETENS